MTTIAIKKKKTTHKIVDTSFHVIIPVEILKKKIPDGSKLLFGLIQSNCLNEKFCVFTNKDFSNYFCVNSRTISKWLRALKDENLIEIYIDKETIHWDRKISICTGL